MANRHLKNIRGQMLIEGVLLMVFSIGLLTVGVRILKGQNMTQSLVSGPWKKTAAMIETGTWSQSPTQGRSLHPNTGMRSRALDPK